MIRHRIDRWQSVARLTLRLGSLHWARVVHDFGHDRQPLRGDRATGALYIPGIATGLRRGLHEFMIEGLTLVNNLLARGATFALRDDGAFVVEIGGVRALAATKEDLFILDEIHVKGSYDVRLGGEAVLLDVGMNVGHASLYFAATMPDLRIVAFEPLAPTFARAQQNLALNPNLAARITTINAGLSAADGSCQVEYSARTPGLVSLFGLPADLPDRGHTSRQTIALRDAAAVLDEVIAAHPARRIVMKVDCEGAEYDIFRRLAQTSRLARVDALLIEWHRLRPEHDPQSLRDLLVGEGFVCLLQHQDPNVGMLYAIRPGTRRAGSTPGDVACGAPLAVAT